MSALEADLLSTYERRTPRSRALHERARRVLPGGDTRTGTFHLPYPLYIDRGAGPRVWDADGNEYLDALGNFTSLIHGHAHPAVTAAIRRQVEAGTAHGTANELQIRLAELIRERVPSVEHLRFCNSGTEATLFALRAARAFTGRPKILKMEGGYHGSHDQVAVAMAPPYETRAAAGLSPGAVSEVLLGTMNDLERTARVVREHRHELAAVIVEPVMGAAGAIPAEPAFLEGLRAVTRECGVLLVLDEIITFRLGPGGAQGLYGITPDLTTFGKIVGGGLPVGAFGGRADVMSTYDPTRPGGIVHSGTFNGNAATMAAGIATLEHYPADAVQRLNARGDALRARLNESLSRRELEATVVGMGSLMQLHFARPPVRSAADAARGNRRLTSLVHRAMLCSGCFTAARQMYVLSTAMTDADLASFAESFDTAIDRVATVVERAAVRA